MLTAAAPMGSAERSWTRPVAEPERLMPPSVLPPAAHWRSSTEEAETPALINNAAGNNSPGGSSNYSVLLPGNAVGSLVDECNISSSDSSSNCSP